MKHAHLSQKLLLATSLSLVSMPSVFASETSLDEKESASSVTPTVVVQKEDSQEAPLGQTPSVDSTANVTTTQTKPASSGGIFSIFSWSSTPQPSAGTPEVKDTLPSALPALTAVTESPEKDQPVISSASPVTTETKKETTAETDKETQSYAPSGLFSYFTTSYWFGNKAQPESSTQSTPTAQTQGKTAEDPQKQALDSAAEGSLQENDASTSGPSTAQSSDEDATPWQPEDGVVLTTQAAALSTDTQSPASTSTPEDMLSSTLDFARALAKTKFSFEHSFAPSQRLGYASFLDKTGVSLYDGAEYTLEFAGRTTALPASILKDQDPAQLTSMNLITVKDTSADKILYSSERVPSLPAWGFLPADHFLLANFVGLGTVPLNRIPGHPVGLLFVGDQSFMLQENDLVNVKIGHAKSTRVEAASIVAYLRAANLTKAPKITQIKRADKVVYSG